MTWIQKLALSALILLAANNYANARGRQDESEPQTGGTSIEVQSEQNQSDSDAPQDILTMPHPDILAAEQEGNSPEPEPIPVQPAAVPSPAPAAPAAVAEQPVQAPAVPLVQSPAQLEQMTRENARAEIIARTWDIKRAQDKIIAFAKFINAYPNATYTEKVKIRADLERIWTRYQIEYKALVAAAYQLGLLDELGLRRDFNALGLDERDYMNPPLPPLPPVRQPAPSDRPLRQVPPASAPQSRADELPDTSRMTDAQKYRALYQWMLQNQGR